MGAIIGLIAAKLNYPFLYIFFWNGILNICLLVKFLVFRQQEKFKQKKVFIGLKLEFLAEKI